MPGLITNQTDLDSVDSVRVRAQTHLPSFRPASGMRCCPSCLGNGSVAKTREVNPTLATAHLVNLN